MIHQRNSLLRLTLAGVVACLTVSCGGGNDGSGFSPPTLAPSCSVATERNFVLNTTREWYLFLELLPATIDPGSFATADDLLDALTAEARSQNKDRFFSFITSIQAEQQFLAQAESVGFGFSSVVREGTRLFLTQVFENSAAAEAGFLRGDEILAIGPSAANLTAVSVLLGTPDGLTTALGPGDPGVTRTFRVRTLGGTEVLRSPTKRTFSLNPVPTTSLIPRTGLDPVGYVNLRTFVSPADAALRAAFAQFRANDVRNVIVDLRYNGGGLVSTAEILGNLLAAQAVGDVLYRTRLNAQKTAEEETVLIRTDTNSIATLNIAFLATNASASASELVINSLSPYANVAIIGSSTFGKPVGQFAFDLRGCDTRLRLVTFKTENKDLVADYFDGLPGPNTKIRLCPAADDLTRAQGDPLETMTSNALSWINSPDVCPTMTAPGDEFATAAQQLPDVYYPRPPRPSPVQVLQPGTF